MTSCSLNKKWKADIPEQFFELISKLFCKNNEQLFHMILSQEKFKHVAVNIFRFFNVNYIW